METKKIVLSDGNKVNVGVLSNPDKAMSWLVFIIPFGQTLDTADALFKHFADRYQLVALEARGILDSEEHFKDFNTLTIDNHCSDVSDVMADLGIEKAVLVGYCSGAGVALQFAAEHPDKTEQLMLVNGEYTIVNDISCSTQYAQDIDALLPIAASDVKTAEYILQKINIAENDDVPVRLDLPYQDSFTFWKFATNYLSYRAQDFISLCSRVTVKAFVLAGKNDIHASPNGSEKMHKHIINSQLILVDDGTHHCVVKPGSGTLVAMDAVLAGAHV